MITLYHYSAGKYKQLLTRSKQGSDAPDEKVHVDRRMPGEHHNHISLFFDPIPLDIMGQIYGEDHHAWAPGNVLFEYRVDVMSLPRKIPYWVTETPTDIRAQEGIDMKKWDVDWSIDSSYAQSYYDDLAKLKRHIGESGQTRDDLIKQIKKFKGQTRDAIITASKKPDFEDFRMLYAGDVPHVLIYPPNGVVEVSSVKKVTIAKRASKLW